MKNNNLLKKLRVCIFSVLLGFAILFSGHHKIHAQSASPSSDPEELEEPTESTSAATIKELQKRIQKISEENRDKIKGALDKFEQKKQALIGSVQRVSEETITIKGHRGTNIISVDDTLTFIKNKKEISLSDIAVDDWVTAMGTIIDDNLETEVVLVSSSSLRPKNDKIDIGTITEITTKNISISSRKDQSDLVYQVDTTTLFKDSSGTEVKSTLFSEDITVIVIGYTDEDGTHASTIQSLAPLGE